MSESQQCMELAEIVSQNVGNARVLVQTAKNINPRISRRNSPVQEQETAVYM